MLKARLFGTPHISLSNQALSNALTGRKLALLSYLLVTDKPCDRAFLADLLWADLPEPQVRKNLRNLVYNLRQVLNDQLIITNTTIAINQAQRHWTDVQAFTSYMTTEFPAVDADLLCEVLKLYQGEFLTGVEIQDAPRFETWLTTQRAYLHEQALQGWRWLGAYYLERQAYMAGLAATRQALTLAPWCEISHRQQMKLLAASGRQQEALAHYESCRQLLATEYSADPLPATTVLYQQIKSQTWSHSAAPQPTTWQPAPERCAVQVNWDAIPQQPQCYGRADELNALAHWLNVEQSRLIFVVGLPGQGKTALLAELVSQLAEAAQEAADNGHDQQPTNPTRPGPPFAQILWYSVANAPSFAQMIEDWLQQLAPPAITERPGALPAHRTPTLERQLMTLLDALRKQRCLLILDQAEALLAQGPQACGYQPAYAPFAEFLRRVCANQHTSAVILSSRIEFQEFALLRQRYSAVRSLALLGLSTAAGVALLHSQGLAAQEAALSVLVEQVAGHPLALLECAELCRTVSLRNPARLFAHGHAIFGILQHKLHEQVQQLTPVAADLLIWLAYKSAPLALETLWCACAPAHSHVPVAEALQTLRGRALVLFDRQADTVALPPIVLTYITQQLVARLFAEIHQLSAQLYQTEHQPSSAPWPTRHQPSSAWPLAGATPLAPCFPTNGRHGPLHQENSAVGLFVQPGDLPNLPPRDHFPPMPLKQLYLNRYPLVSPQATGAVQKEQRCRLMQPLLTHLQAHWGAEETRRYLQELRTVIETTQLTTDGCLAENLCQLLCPANQLDAQETLTNDVR